MLVTLVRDKMDRDIKGVYSDYNSAVDRTIENFGDSSSKNPEMDILDRFEFIQFFLED